MGKNTRYLVIDENEGIMMFYDTVNEICKEYLLDYHKVSDIIAGNCKLESTTKWSEQAKGLTIMKISLVNYHLYNDDIIEAIENYIKIM